MPFDVPLSELAAPVNELPPGQDTFANHLLLGRGRNHSAAGILATITAMPLDPFPPRTNVTGLMERFAGQRDVALYRRHSGRQVHERRLL